MDELGDTCCKASEDSRASGEKVTNRVTSELNLVSRVEEESLVNTDADNPQTDTAKSQQDEAEKDQNMETEEDLPPLSDELLHGQRILRDLMSDSKKAVNWPFMDAVDDSHEDTMDYYEIVDNPMWLKRMRDKFDKRLYETITQFVSDFRLMLENCYRYNGPDHFISKRGQRLEMMLEQKLALLSRDLREKTSVAATSGGKIEESFSSAMRRRVKSNYQRDTSALLNQLRQEEAKRGKEFRRQQILDRKAANEALIQEQLEWENKLLAEPMKSQMNGMWELPQIGHFLFLCQEPLNIGEVPQFELERSFAMAKQSSCMQNVMTTLLSTQHQRTRLEKTGMMPYSVWNEKLNQRLSSWYKILVDLGGDTYKAANKIGIDSFFFDVVGKKNPLLKKKFNDLSFYRKVWIVKSLCDHCLETQESLRDAVERQPIQEQREYVLGFDTKGNQYIHFPQFCGADLRVYRQEPFPEPDSSEEEIEDEPPVAKKKKMESSLKKSTPAKPCKINSTNKDKPSTPDSSHLRRSRRGQSEESNTNNNSHDQPSSSKSTPVHSAMDDASNDSASLPLPSSHRKPKPVNNVPVLLDETSTDSTSVATPQNSRRRRKGGGRRAQKRSPAKNPKNMSESESTCSSIMDNSVPDVVGEQRDVVMSSCEKPSDCDSTVTRNDISSVSHKSTKPEHQPLQYPDNEASAIVNGDLSQKSSQPLITKSECETNAITDNCANKTDPTSVQNSSSNHCKNNANSVCDSNTNDNTGADNNSEIISNSNDTNNSGYKGDDSSSTNTIANSGTEVGSYPDSKVQTKSESLDEIEDSKSRIKEENILEDSLLSKDQKVPIKDSPCVNVKQEVKKEVTSDEVTDFKGNGDGKGIKEEIKEEKEEVKSEKMEEEESEVEEELEPEIGPFTMICDNVDDLRQLVERFAEQEPVVVKRGKKEKTIHPPPRKKCIIELHDRLNFLLNELEPWESKLNAAMRKARVKIRKEFDEYVEEEPVSNWESESEQESNEDSSEGEEDSTEGEEKQSTSSVTKDKPDTKSKPGREEEMEMVEDDIDVSSRGRLRKRRIIPNNVEEGMKKKKVVKKEEAVPTHLPNILRQVKSPVPGNGGVPQQSLTLQPTPMGHTIAIRSSLKTHPQSASQILRMSVNSPNVRQVTPQKSASHPVIQQLLSKEIVSKSQPTLINSSLLNLNTSKPISQVSPSNQPRIQYVITNQQNTSPCKPKPQLTNLASLPAGVLQQLIKNQAIKIQQNSKGETQLVLAAPIQLTTPVKAETATSSAKRQLVITPTTVAQAGVPATPAAPCITTSPIQVPLTSITPPTLTQSVLETPLSNQPTSSSTVLSPGKTSPVIKYASNVTVKALLENRAAQKTDINTPASTNAQTKVNTTVKDSSYKEVLSPKKVVAKLLQVPIPSTGPTSISTSLPTVNIKVPPPVTLPLIQPRKNITRTIQMINGPIPVTCKPEKSKAAAEGVSSSVSSAQTITTLVNSSTGQTVIAHPTVAAKPGLVLQAKTADNKTILLQGQNKQTVVPSALLNSSSGVIQGFLTPQGIQIPSNLLSSSAGSVILQAPKATVTSSSIQASSLAPSLQKTIAAPQVPKAMTNLVASSTTQMLPVRPPGSYFIVQQPGSKGPVQHVQLQKVVGSQNQIVLGTGQALSMTATMPSTTMIASPQAIQVKSQVSSAIPVASSVAKPANKLVFPQNINPSNTATMPAANLVRQIAADQQRMQIPVGSKPVGVQILGQTLPTGQLIQVPQGSITVKGADGRFNQGIQLKTQQLSAKPKPQTVLLSTPGVSQGVPMMTSSSLSSQQLLKQLQGIKAERPAAAPQTTQAASLGGQQVQFHLNVTGNKVGLTPSTQPVVNVIRAGTPSPQPAVLAPQISSQLQTPLSIAIPNNALTMIQNPFKNSTGQGIALGSSSNPDNAALTSATSVGPQKPNQDVSNSSDEGLKTRVVWPKGTKESPKMSTSTKIVQLPVPKTMETGDSVILQSPEKGSSIDSSALDNTPAAKKPVDSPGKQQKLLLYNIGGQLMTAQGVPVTVDQGVLKIISQATIQIGSQTLTVRAPTASPTGEANQIPVSVSGKATPGTILSSVIGKTVLPSTPPKSGQVLQSTVSPSQLHLQSLPIGKEMTSVSSFPYSISSKLVSAPVKSLAQALSSSKANPVQTTSPTQLTQASKNILIPESAGRDKQKVEAILPKGELTVRPVLEHMSMCAPSNENTKSNTDNCSSGDMRVQNNGTNMTAVNNVSNTSNPAPGLANISIPVSSNTISNGSVEVPFTTVHSPEKEAAKNLLALANQTLLSQK